MAALSRSFIIPFVGLFRAVIRQILEPSVQSVAVPDFTAAQDLGGGQFAVPDALVKVRDRDSNIGRSALSRKTATRRILEFAGSGHHASLGDRAASTFPSR